MTPMWRCNVITALHHFARYLHRVMAERGGSPAVHCSQSNWPRSQRPDWSRSTSQGSKIWVKLVDDIRSSPQIGRNPANTRRWPDVGLMMARRLRRRPIINSTMGQRLVFAGDPPIYVPSRFDNTLVDHDAALSHKMSWLLGQLVLRLAHHPATWCVWWGDRLAEWHQRSPPTCITEINLEEHELIRCIMYGSTGLS